MSENPVAHERDLAVLASAASDSAVLNAVIRRTDAATAAWAVRTAAELLADLEDAPFLLGGTNAGANAAFVEAMTMWTVLSGSGLSRLPAGLEWAVRSAVRDRVRLDMPLNVLLEGVRAVQWRLRGRVHTRWDSAGATTLLRVLARHHGEEHHRWHVGLTAKRVEVVSQILEGAAVDTAVVFQQLGYDITQRHVALVLRRTEGGSSPSADPAANARSALRGAGCFATLVVPVGPSRIWAWGGWPADREVEFDPVTAAGSGVHVAAGMPGDGLAGFRRSHAQAVAAEEADTGSGRSGGTASFATVEPFALLGSDLTAAREFVRRQLGPLAEHLDTAAVLESYLDNDRNLAATGRRLNISTSAVTHRVKKAERLLGRSSRDGRLHLHLALHLLHFLGPEGDL